MRKWLVFRLKNYAEDVWARLGSDGEIIFDCTDAPNDWIADCNFSELCNIEFTPENGKIKIYDCQGNLITEGYLVEIIEEEEEDKNKSAIPT